jgi:hypothetical protein
MSKVGLAKAGSPATAKNRATVALVLIGACGVGLLAYARSAPAPAVRRQHVEDTPVAEAEDDTGHGPHAVEPDSAASRAAQLAKNELMSRLLAALAAANAQRAAQGEHAASNDVVAPSREELVAQRKAEAATLDAQLDREPVDAHWAAQVERDAANAILRLQKNVRLEAVTCRETLCRAKVTHLDPGREDEDVEGLLNMPIGFGQAFVTPNEDQSTSVYFSRAGKTLSVLQVAPGSNPPPSAESATLQGPTPAL